MRSPAVTILLLVFLVAGPAAAAGTRHVVHAAADFAEGELDGLALDAEGRLLAAPHRARTWEVEAPYVWCLARDGEGRLLAGSGDSGTVLRQDGDELRPWARTLAFEVLSLLPREGHVLAGTSPDGVVYRIEDDGTVEVALDLPQQSVWCLAEGSAGEHWLAGGGPGARLVRVGARHPAGEVLHELPAANLMNLVRDEGGLWLATQGPGLLYRIEGDDGNEPRLVHEAAEEEIRTLVGDGAGGVYLLALSAPASEKEDEVHSRVLRVTAAGAVEEIHEAPVRYLGLARLPDGGLLLGEAGTGRLHRLDPRRDSVALWTELEGGDPLALLPLDDGAVAAATGNPGRVYVLRRDGRRRGMLTSGVIHAEGNEAWGRLQVEHRGAGLRVSTRSGVRREPDTSWSAWSEAAAPGSVPESPVAPYLQYRLALGGEVEVTSVRLSWRERNLAPRVRSVEVEPAGGPLDAGGINGGAPSPVSQRFDDGLAVEYSVAPKSRPIGWEDGAWARGLRTVRWQVDDPNGDRLRYRLEVRGEPDGSWYRLGEDLAVSLYAWDTRSFPDGGYRLRVTADDGLDNAASLGRSGEAVSALITVDNTPPVIEEWGFADDASTVLRGRVTDAGSPLVDLSLRVGEGPWRPILPEDGVVDGPAERFRLDRPEDADSGGRLWLRVADAAGNTALLELPVP